MNGPKIWTPDWSEGYVGKTRDFNGMEASWVGTMYSRAFKGKETKMKNYTPAQIYRVGRIGWNKGTKVILMDDDKGNTYIMKGFELGKHPKYSYKSFEENTEEKLPHLPKGWNIRVKVLEKDLIEQPENGNATIIGDELLNVYDKTGPGMTNYIP